MCRAGAVGWQAATLAAAGDGPSCPSSSSLPLPLSHSLVVVGAVGSGGDGGALLWRDQRRLGGYGSWARGPSSCWSSSAHRRNQCQVAAQLLPPGARAGSQRRVVATANLG